jgi:hypothetical protein
MRTHTGRVRLLTAACACGTVLCLAARLHAQSPTLLRLRNAASLDRLVLDSAGGLLLVGATGHGSIPASGPGIRMMWYPAKGAFRAGLSTATGWDDAQIGSQSFAVNHSTTASGQYSDAFGDGTGATAEDAFAAGLLSYATGVAATAFGEHGSATGEASFAAGYEAASRGRNSVALGTHTAANGHYSLSAGYYTTASGVASTVLGAWASTAGHQGAFVYGDYSTASVQLEMEATADNQVSMRASGGVRLFTDAYLGSGVTLAAGGSAWNVVSDRRRKEAFLPLDGEDMLARIRALPLSTWRYIAEEDRSTRHIGPMAQDWQRAFGFARDSLTINSGDLDGVNLAGVQALEARTRAQAERIDALEAENRALRGDQAELRRRMKRLEAHAAK